MKTLRNWVIATVCGAILSVAYRLTADGQVPLIASYLHWNSSTTLTTQGGYLGWNFGGLGEADFQNANGTGVGGYQFYNGTGNTLLGSLDYHGNFTATNSLIAPNALINGNNSLTSAQGLNLAWNETAGNGESDFVNQYQSGGVGGFNWYNTGTSSSHGSPLMQLSSAGNITVAQVTAALVGALTGNVTGNLTGNSAGTHTGANIGNASTATALAAAPSGCATANTFGNSIAASGNLGCGAPVGGRTTTVGTTASGAYSTATAVVPLSATMPDTNYYASCSGIGVSGVPAIQAVTKGTTSITVTIINGTGSGATASTYTEIDCVIAGT